MKRSSSGRRSYSAEQRAAIVHEFRASRQTQQVFARRRGIKWTTFRNWLYPGRVRTRTPSRAVGFQEIRIAPLNLPAVWGAEISLAGGTVVRLQAGADPQWVQAILQPLRPAC